MSHMFHNCKSLKELNIFNFNIDEVENINYMFYKCESLKKNNYL